jgi:hypothetical protein
VDHSTQVESIAPLRWANPPLQRVGGEGFPLEMLGEWEDGLGGLLATEEEWGEKDSGKRLTCPDSSLGLNQASP